MHQSLETVGYLFAAILFILSLSGLSKQKTARRGNLYGIAGMALAIVLTFMFANGLSYQTTAAAIIIGTAIGALAATRVAMTSMPELVAILHSFVGLAAVLVGMATFLDMKGNVHASSYSIEMIEIYVDVAIGAITFTGSIIAWGKLAGKVTSNPLILPLRHVVNILIVVGIVGVAVPYMGAHPHSAGLTFLITNAVLAGVLGLHLVLAIGGADMPVVVSLLNSYSGWAAAAAGFMLSNDLLIITGALVGSSGAILSYIMCRGMNRSLVNVIFGGFGAKKSSSASAGKSAGEQGEVNPATAIQVADLVKHAHSVAVIPGYGMAVAQAQHAISQLTRKLRENGTDVTFGIHPVAGRMPGHMNVLLAEADIPYDIVLEMEDINPKLPATDVVLVVGANDIVNPDAMEDDASPIYGMPQLEVWNAHTVVVLKRSLSPGYAGVANPLFFRNNTRMFFGDAKKSLNDLLDAL